MGESKFWFDDGGNEKKEGDAEDRYFQGLVQGMRDLCGLLPDRRFG
jgi:hypothetical protein